ncbi:GerAB/ArcD/ProY family transporter [[Clostridium] polysaccharolyticum]|uniref:Spore germination protein (Amino acid permease) n=1 Tax=[Clostridium] polysaccharolyticum TaxID=29364 RepID=A0A1I0DF16_9FIRM|nr:GerAB/ArcD/ProY family transporter [[Clostridium] polysaccharolyticum]SET30335.1 spore germination protein (amino acid permease) [[Clostridium] polysaccharolyticum]
MKYQISIRQFIFLFIFTAITPLFTYVPQIAAQNAQNSGYISTLYFGAILLVYAAVLLRIMRVYPDQNFYEILSSMIGSVLSRFLFFLYGIWTFLLLIFKLSFYNLLIQATLMDNSRNYIILFGLFFLVLYAAFKGTKTIFRVSELLYGLLIFFLIVLLIFTLPNINKEFLAPVTREQLRLNVPTLWTLAPIGGNLFFLLFFLRPVSHENQYSTVKKRVFQSIFVFFLISYLTVFLTIGIAGATLTSQYSYSFFQAIKCITFLSSLERFDSLITLITVISDFITITFYLLLVMKCFTLAFGIDNYKEIAVITLTIACTIACVFDVPQYTLEHYYRVNIDRISLLFQYAIPVILGIICCFKKPKLSRRNIVGSE